MDPPAPPILKTFKPHQFVCHLGTTARCRRGFVSLGGLHQHRTAAHPTVIHAQPPSPTPSPSLAPSPLPSPHPPSSPPHLYQASIEEVPDEGDFPAPLHAGARRVYHPLLDGVPIDADGNDLPPNTPPPAYVNARDTTSWTPFRNRTQFELADFLFRQDQMPATRIDTILELWASSQKEEEQPPFADHTDLYKTIDSIMLGDVKWDSFSVRYTGMLPDGEPPPWMQNTYDVWFRDLRALILNQLSNPNYDGKMDYAPVQVFNESSERVWSDFMTENWAWRQVNEIAKDPETHGAMLVPIILSSDKTTVSVATGHTEFYPLYLSNGNVRNNVQRAHRNAVSLIGFLAIPKTNREYANDGTFCKFRRQLYHISLTTILESLCTGMTTPEIARCPDGHLRRIIFSLGSYIADYPEQVMLACIMSGWCPKCGAPADDLDSGGIPRSHEYTCLLMDTYDVKTLWDRYGIIDNVLPFTTAFPRANIHELLSFDILHQVIKGTFKDHLMSWVESYLKVMHGANGVSAIIADIDQRIAAVPSFLGLRRFSDGRGFKQWTGDNSKALMKVYLPAITGHIPPQMVCAISTFINFCYLVHRSVITESTLQEIDDALAWFHANRVIFEETGVRVGFSLPRQHSLTYYYNLIQDFGAPNGLCSLITESKHIKAVKEPW
ncbi:hypothetical protein EW146_g7563 [Bondarzewia mesenterica]|uniref:C2H2-type domain-containing protein n=1 Tax=Bondarzewia mesenterica TaxID=1095465 RepID=A0A4V3XE78_9AGAM|nr:hypothetical protein EW146_g7563 [Bondarzewia mesenterica]